MRRRFTPFLLATIVLGLGGAARADLVTIEGTVRSVDAKAHTLTVTRKTSSGEKTITLDVSPEAKVVGGKGARLDALSAGQTVRITYESKLEVVTKVEASGGGAGATARPELVKLNELNTDGMDFGPWVSGDGLTIYWSVASQGQPPWVWTASRRDADSLFENPKRLFPGVNPTVTKDGLVMIFHDQKGSLQTTSRRAVDQPFKRPTPVPELQGQPYCRRPGLSGDGLTLLFERVRGEGKGMEICVTSRTAANAPWSSPKPLPIDFRNAPQSKPSSPFLTRDGTALLLADFRKFDGEGSNIMVWTRSRPGGPFDKFEYLKLDDIPAFGICPRYVEATHELFFNSDRAVSDKLDDKEKGPELFVIKNFKLPVLGETPTPKSGPTPRSK